MFPGKWVSGDKWWTTYIYIYANVLVRQPMANVGVVASNVFACLHELIFLKSHVSLAILVCQWTKVKDVLLVEANIFYQVIQSPLIRALSLYDIVPNACCIQFASAMHICSCWNKVTHPKRDIYLQEVPWHNYYDKFQSFFLELS